MGEKERLAKAVELLEKVTNSLDLVLDWYCDLSDTYVEDSDELMGMSNDIKEALAFLEEEKKG